MLATRRAGGGSLTVPLVHHLTPGMSSIFKSPSILPLQSLFPKKAELVTQHRAPSMDRKDSEMSEHARMYARARPHTPSPGTRIGGSLSPSWLTPLRPCDGA